MENSTKKRDKWDKWDILLKPVGGLLTALSVAAVGFFGSQYLNKQQTIETNMRLYAQIMSGREKADSDLRKDMFNSIIKAFLVEKKSQNGEGAPTEEEKLLEIEKKVLALELIAYNFHNIIDLGPLFKHVEKQISAQPSLQHRLENVAQEVTSKQIAALQDVGVVKSTDVFFEDIKENPAGVRLFGDEPMRLVEDATTDEAFYMLAEVLSIDENKKEMRVRLDIYQENKKKSETDTTFKIGFFDFPMIDNTQMPNGQRVALGISRWEQDLAAQIWLAYFPGSRASLKEKPYYDEVLQELDRSRKNLAEDEGWFK